MQGYLFTLSPCASTLYLAFVLIAWSLVNDPVWSLFQIVCGGLIYRRQYEYLDA